MTNVLKVKPHLRSLAKCSGASSRGNGRPTKVTSRWLAGNASLSSFTGLTNTAPRQHMNANARRSPGHSSSQRKRTTTTMIHSRFAAPRQIYAPEGTHTPVCIDKMAPVRAEGATGAQRGPVVREGGCGARDVRYVDGRMRGGYASANVLGALH
jgi:hypothetical protein